MQPCSIPRDKRFLLCPAPSFELAFSTHSLRLGGELFLVQDGVGAIGGGMLGAFSMPMPHKTSIEVGGVPDLVGLVGTVQDVDEPMHD